MGERTLAKRYARALLAVAKEQDEITRIEEELHSVAALWRDVPELRAMLGSPALARAQKAALLDRLLSGKVTAITLRFLSVVLEKKRFAFIEEIAQAYDDLSDEAQGIARAKVTTWIPLSDEQRKALVERLKKFTERPNLILSETVDPEILGGIVVRIGDEVFDASLRGRLRAGRERFFIREEERATAAAAMVGTK